MNKFLQLFFFFIFFQEHLLAIEIYGNAKVIDGDTIRINNKKIRLLGIDAFEIKQKCKKRNGSQYKCGQIAKSVLIEIISNQHVKCISEKKDYYKRWLATCYVGKLDIGENMVLLGYAIAFMSKKYKNVQEEAKKVKAGAWQGEFTSPKEWRKENM